MKILQCSRFVLFDRGMEKQPEKQPCRFYEKGSCNRGGNCIYSHITETPMKRVFTPPRKGQCKYFYTQDGCAKGSACTFSHGVGRSGAIGFGGLSPTVSKSPSRGGGGGVSSSYSSPSTSSRGRQHHRHVRSPAGGASQVRPKGDQNAAAALRSALFGFRAVVLEAFGRATAHGQEGAMLFRNVDDLHVNLILRGAEKSKWFAYSARPKEICVAATPFYVKGKYQGEKEILRALYHCGGAVTSFGFPLEEEDLSDPFLQVVSFGKVNLFQLSPALVVNPLPKPLEDIDCSVGRKQEAVLLPKIPNASLTRKIQVMLEDFIESEAKCKGWTNG